MAFIIGDVHGSFNTLLALIEKLPKDEQIVFVGDLVDRGPKSKEVVQFIIDNNYQSVLGNHDDFMTGKGIYGFDSWIRNGAENTLASYGVKYRNTFSGGYVDQEESDPENYLKFKEHQDWMGKLPLYLLFDDVVNDAGEKLLVSHSSIAKVWKWPEERRTQMHSLFKEHIIWERNYNPQHIPGIFNVFGHTAVSEPIIRGGAAFIDTGAVYKKKLTALRFPQMEIFTQDYID